MTTENMNEEEIEKEIEREEQDDSRDEKDEHEGREESKANRDDQDDEEDEKPKRNRPSKRDRTTERVFGKLSSIEKALEHIPTLAERLEKLERSQAEVSKRSDPKPKFADFDDAESYETALESWFDRNPKQPEQKEKKEERNAPQNSSPKQIAEALGITLETYEDFQAQVEDAREEFEDYDEVMEGGKSLLANNPKLTKAFIEFEEYEGATGPILTYHLLKDREGRKEFKRIAALSKKRERDDALEALAESLKDGGQERDDSRSNKQREQKPFRPVDGRRPPHSRAKDESTESAEDFFAREEKQAGYRR